MADTPQYGSDYIVGWKLRIVLRLDEFSDVTRVRNLAADPIIPPQTMRGVTSARSQATCQKTATGYAVGFAGGTVPTAGDPQSPNSSKDGLTYSIGAVIPKQFAWTQNGFKEPDKLQCELRYVDVPFDPLCFRAVGVEFYLGTMTVDDYQAGMIGATRQVVIGATQISEPLNVIPDGFTGPNGEARTNMRFQGFVDEWEVEYSDKDLAVVRFTCSDNTRLLMDQPMPPGLRLDTSKPVDQAIAQLLSQFPQFSGLTVEYRPAIVPVPTLGPLFSAHAQMPDGLQASQGGATQTLSVWDFLVEVAGAFGHNIRVEGSVIVVQRIRAALGKNFPPRIGDPFTGRTWGGSDHLLRTFIWGRNCKTVHRQKKYARTTMNVEVRSYSPEKKTTLVARFPPFGNSKGLGGNASGPNASTNRLVHVLPGDGKQETKYTVYPVPGVSDQKTLQNIAQAYYEGLNRSELGLILHTRDLASFGGDASDPDVLDILAGDRFEYLTERFDASSPDYPSSELGQLEDSLLQVTKGYDYLTALGFDPAFVSTYLGVYASTGFQTTFVVKRMTVNGTIEDGVDITVDGANMVEARVDAPGVADGDDASLGAQGTSAPTNQSQPSGGP